MGRCELWQGQGLRKGEAMLIHRVRIDIDRHQLSVTSRNSMITNPAMRPAVACF
jgi:hypothetical protein